MKLLDHQFLFYFLKHFSFKLIKKKAMNEALEKM